MKKRILPALLVLCMVMSLLPTVFATAATCTCKDKAAHSATEGACTQETENENGVCDQCASHDQEYKDPTCNCVGYKAADVGESAKCSHEGACTETEDLNEDGLCTECAAAKAVYDKTVVISCTCAVHKTSEKPAGCPGAVTLTDAEQETKRIVEKVCDACAASTICNRCTYGPDGHKCTLLNGHGGKHTNDQCPGDSGTADCGAAEHSGTCAARCDALDSAKPITAWTETEKTEGSAGDAKCTLPKGHLEKGIPHNNNTCVAADGCGAPTHFPGIEGKAAVEASGTQGEPGYVAGSPEVEAVPGCAMAAKTAKKCGLGGCTKPANHTGEHSNKVCLGVNDDMNCQTTLPDEGKHIFGCSKYTCECEHEYTGFNGENTLTCSAKDGCALCAAWNVFVNKTKGEYETAKKAYDQYVKDQEAYEAAMKADPTQTAVKAPEKVADPGSLANADKLVLCACTACNASRTPGLGEVTNNDGETVDPAAPAEPSVPDVPVKAEDFTDIDADDPSTEWLVKAVQTMLDNGWMQGVGGSKFDAGTEASTGMVLTVVARMYGEDGIEGANYAELAKAWADENELTEGIDLESDTIARKDIILLLWRLAGKSDSEQELEFTDIEGVEGDYLTALKWAVEKGIVMGNGDGTVTPDGILTRGQLAALVARYADNVK